MRSLLDEIKRDPERLTRRRFLALFPPDDAAAQAGAQAAWPLQYAGSVGSHVDPVVVELDRKGLVAVAERVKRYADERIAHTKRERLRDRPAFGDIDKAIDVIGPLYRKRALLLRGHATILERSTRADVVELFRVPWVRP